MNLAKYVACICEGSAERAIIKLLLDENRLIFTWDDLLEGEILRCRNAKKFEEQHLRKGFTDKITVLRILDSRRENFKLSKAYVGKIDVVNVITAPEIEMLVIFAENLHLYSATFCILWLQKTVVGSNPSPATLKTVIQRVAVFLSGL